MTLPEHPGPALEPDAWIAPGAVVIGDVTVGSRASIWFNAVIRADQEKIAVGPDSNVQDGAVLHADPGLPLTVGERVSIGHGAVLHGCTIGDDVLVGMGATVLNGATVGAGSLIAAGALVLEGADIPARSLVAGVPGKVRRPITDEELASIVANAQTYLALSARYAAGAIRPWRTT